MTRLPLSDVIQQFKDQKISADSVVSALLAVPPGVIYAGERWFALPVDQAPRHFAFFLPHTALGSIEVTQVPDGSPDAVLAEKYGFRLASEIFVNFMDPGEIPE